MYILYDQYARPLVVKFVYNDLSSVESQKGVNAVQRCSGENQKGAIIVQSVWQ